MVFSKKTQTIKICYKKNSIILMIIFKVFITYSL